MWSFDLKTLIFLLLTLLAALIGMAYWLAGQRRQGGTSKAAGGVTPPRVLEDAPFGWLVLEGPSLRYANSYARRLLRLNEPQSELPDADWTPLLDDDRTAARREGSGRGRYRNVTFASGRTARWWVTPRETRDFVFLLDVTAQQRTERAGRTLINDLSHELRTPVATILTHLEILSLDDVGEEVHEQSVALSRAEAQRMARLVDDMLELGRLEMAPEMVRRPLDLLALVEEVALQVTPRAAERDMDLTLEADSPLPLILGNMDRLRQVFLNLLDNALKYARPGDRITITLREREGKVACTVCDTGPGIPPEHLPHVIRRFYRAAPGMVEGSGLGLALVAEILRRHESRLEIESPVAEGAGTCARFLLPGVESDA